jgi:hypothetical protein
LPEISRFEGIVIRMFVERGNKHHEPHFHAYYQDAVASYRINQIELLRGSLPTRQRRLVEAWAELYREELLANWRRLQNDRRCVKIAPLR